MFYYYLHTAGSTVLKLIAAFIVLAIFAGSLLGILYAALIMVVLSFPIVGILLLLGVLVLGVKFILHIYATYNEEYGEDKNKK